MSVVLLCLQVEGGLGDIGKRKPSKLERDQQAAKAEGNTTERQRSKTAAPPTTQVCQDSHAVAIVVEEVKSGMPIG